MVSCFTTYLPPTTTIFYLTHHRIKSDYILKFHKPSFFLTLNPLWKISYIYNVFYFIKCLNCIFRQQKSTAASIVHSTASWDLIFIMLRFNIKFYIILLGRNNSSDCFLMLLRKYERKDESLQRCLPNQKHHWKMLFLYFPALVIYFYVSYATYFAKDA